MPRLRATARPGVRMSGGPGGFRFSTLARVVAGVAAVAGLEGGSPGPGHLAGARDASRTAKAAGSRVSGAAGAVPSAARAPSPGAANPDPSIYPYTGPAAPPGDAALVPGRAGAPLTIMEFGDYASGRRGQRAVSHHQCPRLAVRSDAAAGGLFMRNHPAALSPWRVRSHLMDCQ